MLQRKLIRYLHDKTDNQYFIATHSAHLLDSVGASVFHVRLEDGVTRIETANSPAARSNICVDLGYRASDIVQANCVIWVEGPSDRVYLKHWIGAIDNGLIEGLHYSIMFYGGRLLNHLTANDPEVDDFISLRRLNRYISILIDSDRNAPLKRPNATKLRVKSEFDLGPGFAWISKGREIENYLPVELLELAVTKVHPHILRLPKTGQFDNVLEFKKSSAKADKVKIAHEVVKNPADLSILDLKKMISKLVAFVRSANELDGN